MQWMPHPQHVLCTRKVSGMATWQQGHVMPPVDCCCAWLYLAARRLSWRLTSSWSSNGQSWSKLRPRHPWPSLTVLSNEHVTSGPVCLFRCTASWPCHLWCMPRGRQRKAAETVPGTIWWSEVGSPLSPCNVGMQQKCQSIIGTVPSGRHTWSSMDYGPHGLGARA